MFPKTTHKYWPERRVFITGASGGLGSALARELAPRVAALGLLGRRQEALETLATELHEDYDCHTAWATTDVRDQTRTAASIAQLEATLGPCDVFVANAGVYRKTRIDPLDAEAANEVVATNVQGTFNCFAAALKTMTARQTGHLVAVSSIAALMGLPGAAAYSASKAALVTLCQSLRVDLHPYQIDVTVVCPGFVDTPMITAEERETLKSLLTAPEAASRIRRAVERRRAEHWFPFSTWLPAALVRRAPSGLYRQIMGLVPEMEEA